MIFVKVNNENNVVEFVHYHPFDEKYGLGKTVEELQAEGMLVDSIPEPVAQEGKGHILKYNPSDKTFYYEYFDLPKTVEEQLEGANNKIALMQQALDELLLGGM
jgi:hypothetical protein